MHHKAFLKILRLTVLLGVTLLASTLSAQSHTMSDYEHGNLEQNLRWIIQRNGAAKDKAAARVGVYADAGVWHPGARSIVDALERDGVPCEVIDKSSLKIETLKRFDALVLPGGWAPLQWASAGEQGLKAIGSFVENGGRCVGICAGAYLVSKTVNYDDESFDYPLGLFDGVASGPVAGLARFPEPGKANLKVSDAGRKRGLAEIDLHEAYYSGGPCFKDGTNIVVLAQYADGSAAVISRAVGAGEVVLIGAHVERPVDSTDDTTPPPEWAGGILKALLALPGSSVKD